MYYYRVAEYKSKNNVSRNRRDKSFRLEFGHRLKKLIEDELKVSVGDIASALNYHDASTLRSAMAGRCGLDLERLALLASWSKARGTPVNLHWLLVGEGLALPVGVSGFESNWLSAEVYHALTVIARAVPETSNR